MNPSKKFSYIFILAILTFLSCGLFPTTDNGPLKSMVLISAKGKSFTMGDSSSALLDFTFPHQVQFSHDFYMDDAEVTQEDFQNLMGYDSSFYHGSLNLPVESVTWYEAALYCNKRSKISGFDTIYSYDSIGIYDFVNLKINFSGNGFRLPTEAEWEYACRGGNSGLFYYNTLDFSPYEWIPGNSGDKTHEGKLKISNPYGLYDMLGNVSEWCNDYYDTSYYKVSEAIDPKGPASGIMHVRRGGCNQENAFTYTRPFPCFLYGSLGFRCIKIIE
jgi:formylglycine-generating enzyme